MKRILFYTRKYFYAREITDYLNFFGFQVLTYWQPEDLFRELSLVEPWLVLVDYAHGEENWVDFFEKLWEAKNRSGLGVIAFWEKGARKLEPRLIDRYLEKPLVLSELRALLDNFSLSCLASHESEKHEAEPAPESFFSVNDNSVNENYSESPEKPVNTSDHQKAEEDQAENVPVTCKDPEVCTEMPRPFNTDSQSLIKELNQSIAELENLQNQVKILFKTLETSEQEKAFLKSENHYLKAYIHNMKNNRKDALKECRTALELDPTHQKARKMLAHLS